jgi:hypothetical protein
MTSRWRGVCPPTLRFGRVGCGDAAKRVCAVLGAFLLLLLLALVAAPQSALAEAAVGSDEESVRLGRQALNGRTSYPFYDPAQDDIRRVDVKADPTKKAAEAGAKWTAKPQTPTTRNWRGSGSGLGTVFQVVGLGLLTLIIAGVIVLLVKAFMQGEQLQTQGTKFVDISHEADKVEDLPFQLKKPSGDFLSEARRLYEEGRYSEAIIYLFSYQLVALDKRHVIHLAKGKTNRQYLRETRSREPLRQVLQRTMISFEDVFFGHHELSRDRFEECWNQLEEFHRQLEKVEVAST